MHFRFLDAQNRFAVMFDYDSGRYNRESMKVFMSLWKKVAMEFAQIT